MCIKEFIIIKTWLICLALCLASSSSSNEEMARDFIEHVLRIPNPDKVLNSVLGRLERNRQESRNRQPISDNLDCDAPCELLPEYTESLGASLPFTRGASRERDLRQLGKQKHYPICNLQSEIITLNTNEYEYRPAYYEEVRCAMQSSDDVNNEICSSLGFSCVQWNKTIHLTRRRYSSDCWETRTLVIPAGCECMWPVDRLGDMKLHV